MPRARRVALGVVLSTVVFAGGCASGRFVPPTVAPAPFPEGRDAWASATEACRAVSTYRAELRVAGRLFGPSVTLAVALDDEGRVAMDARASGTSVFTLRGSETAATLVLPERRQYVTARPEEILEALVNASVGTRRLLAVLTGCVAVNREVSRAERLGRVGRVVTADTEVYLARVGDRWRVRAGTFGDVSVDYRELGADGPRRIVLRSGDPGRPSELTLVVAAFDTARVGAAQFVATVPSSATPVSLEELRRDGPFARREN